MKEVIIRNHWNFEPLPEDTEKVDRRTKTVQEKDLSIQEIYDKYSKGIVPQVLFDPQYSDTEDFDAVDPVLNMQDLTDIDAARQAVSDAEQAANEARNAAEEAAKLAQTNQPA